MDKFEIGACYGVLHFDDRAEAVTVVDRGEHHIVLADGRRAAILLGIGPQGADEELVRLDEEGALARGGVVRACQRRAALDASRALATQEAKACQE